MNKKDLYPTNDKGEAHGYWLRYADERIWYKGLYINGKRDGLWISRVLNFDGFLDRPAKTFFIR